MVCIHSVGVFFPLLVVYFPFFFLGGGGSSFWFSLTWWLWFDLHRHFFFYCAFFFLLRGCLTIRRWKCKRVPVAIVSTVPLPTPLSPTCLFVASFLLACPHSVSLLSTLTRPLYLLAVWLSTSDLLSVFFCSLESSQGCAPVSFHSRFLSVFKLIYILCICSWAISEFIAGIRMYITMFGILYIFLFWYLK